MTGEAAARDFVADAFAHCKFIGYHPAAAPLFAKAGVALDVADQGLMLLDSAKSVSDFIESCRRIRVWAREQAVKI